MTVLALVVAGTLSLQAQVKYSPVVAFGDSLSDMGNVAMCTNKVTDSGTHLDGTWVKQLADMFGYALTPSKTGGTDYAVAGAPSGGVIKQTKAYLDANAGAASPTALYTFYVGGNDIVATIKHGKDGVMAATNAADTVKAAIDTLAKAGAVNFVWPNLFPIKTSPVHKDLPDTTPAVDAFDKEQALAIAALQSEHPNIKIFNVDFNALATTGIKDPTTQGFTNWTEAWLKASAETPYSKLSSNPDSDKFVFFDGLHPTTHFHHILAEEVYKDLQAP